MKRGSMTIKTNEVPSITVRQWVHGRCLNGVHAGLEFTYTALPNGAQRA